MSKWFGNIGYATTAQTEPGVWEKVIEEKGYYGDIINNRFLHQNSGEVNDDITLSNVVSIIADPFAYKNCANMAYVSIMGVKWKITNVEIQHPRLILTVGGVYNGQ